MVKKEEDKFSGETTVEFFGQADGIFGIVEKFIWKLSRIFGFFFVDLEFLGQWFPLRRTVGPGDPVFLLQYICLDVSLILGWFLSRKFKQNY